MKQTGSRAGSVVVDVVEAVADATETDPIAMEPPLQTVIDAEALERLVGGSTVSRVTFEYDGHTVTVDGEGAVAVESAGEPAVPIEATTGEEPITEGAAAAPVEDDSGLEDF